MELGTTAKPLHVAVLAFPFSSHPGPLLDFARRIAAHSATPENTTFSFFCTADANASLFSEQNNPRLPPNFNHYHVHDGLPDAYVPSGHPIEKVYLFLNAMPENYRRAMDVAVAETGKKISCIITDAFLWFGADMAAEMNAKWIPLWMAGPHALLLHVLTDLLRQKLEDDVCEEQSLSFVGGGLSKVKIEDLPEGVVKGIDDPFAIMLHKMGQMLPRATTVAINSCEAILPPAVNELKSKFQMLLNVGPLTTTQSISDVVPDEHGCLEWLDKHEKASVVYIGFGSVIVPPPHELAAIAEALEETKFPFIWSFRGDPEKLLPEGMLERTKSQGKVVQWAPQVRILRHSSIGVFVTHGGWNSILESILGGVPMICRPFFGDQMVNARMLEAEWGIGMAVKNGGLSNKDEAVKILGSALLSEEGKIMREKIAFFKEAATKAVEPCGSSTQNFNTLVDLATTS
ncbi:flavonoid 3-O-glucosyltransferase-like [Senna tora]|uniref:Glycosyltransferase n=1 Tax=Senna tora TaxID=362788 RepID=A0A835CCK9_9FABA|nr:flavonoid 3-O-glucosyltransferase-like [Senna tora]